LKWRFLWVSTLSTKHTRRDLFTMPRKPKSQEKTEPTKTLPPRKLRNKPINRLIDTFGRRLSHTKQSPKLLKKAPEGKKPSKPNYLSMIKKAIKETKDRKGASDRAIVKYIEANYPVYGNFKVRVRSALARGVANKVLTQRKRHFNITPTFKAKKQKTTKETGEKKKRGRPPKSESKKKSSKKPKKSSTKESKETGEKKKRGRPPKSESKSSKSDKSPKKKAKATQAPKEKDTKAKKKNS